LKKRGLGFLFCFLMCSDGFAQALIIDNHTTDITQIPSSAIEDAKAALHIAYGHTSHGSQLTTGMTGLVAFANGGGLGLNLAENMFQWNNGGTGGALDLHDYAMGGDVGYYPQWVDNTRSYLDNPANGDVNVIIWSWCGQASSYTEQQMIDNYLSPMSQLEQEYPEVTFVYMTGHADGTGETGNLHLRNQQIRNYCITNSKVLYDFYNIESYDPEGNYYGDKLVTDNCDYDSDGNGSRDGNWAIEWQNAHTEGVDWYSCSSAHSQPLNANRKAYAAWWLWAVLAGWNPTGDDLCPDDPDKTDPGICGCGVSDTDTDSDGTPDCNDNCPGDAIKVEPGVCGCDTPDIDSDSDGTLDCNDDDGIGDNTDEDDDNDTACFIQAVDL